MGEITPGARAPAIFEAPEPLNLSHDTSIFDCGNPSLDDWLKTRALKSEGRSARCYVVVSQNQVVAGYYCVSAGAVAHEGAPRKLRQNMPDPIPVVIVGRLAVDRRHQAQGLGRALLKDALLRITKASSLVGARAVLVHAIDENAVPFYASYGFQPFPSSNLTLFLPIDQIIASL